MKSTERGLREKKTQNKYPNMIILMDKTRCLTLKINKMMTCFHFKVFLLGKKEKKNHFIYLKEIPFF